MRSGSVGLLAVCSMAAWFWMARPLAAENWPGWRGDGNAVSREAGLPVRWRNDMHVRWRVEVPGQGYSSPIVWEDRVFVTSAFDDGVRRSLQCLDRSTGRLLWARTVEHDNPELASAMTGYAAPTPVTDGRHVVAFFGNAGILCCDFQGELLWRRDLGQFDSELGIASSPLLDGQRVIVLCDHDGNRFKSFDSYVAALHLRDGQIAWKTDRKDLFRSWSTPLSIPKAAQPGRRELIINAQDQLRGYDPADGKELWRVNGMTGWVTPSPVFAEGLIFATSGRDGPILAVRPGGEGDVTKSHLAWEHHSGAPYVVSPVYFERQLYVLNEQGILSAFAAKTGELIYRERLEGKFVASPVAGDGKLYFTNDEGTTYVVRAGERFELLSGNRLGEYTLASPAISGRQFFLRTKLALYCIQAGD